MPTLDIIDDNGKLKQLAPVYVAAAMFSPTDERRRDEIIATGYVDTALQVRQPLPPEIVEVTHSGPGTATISSQAGHQGYLGWVAGQILLFVLRCAAHRPEDASVRKAIEINGLALVREERLQGRKFSSSTTTIRNAWGDYKSVSHLWAALHILEKGEYGLNTENLTEFLGAAEFLRGRGEGHYPPPKRVNAEPLLAPNEAWRAPEILGLPHIAFEAPPLSKQELCWLADYRVPTK